MNQQRKLWLVGLLATCVLAIGNAWGEAEAGVVVEKTAGHSEGERAGLQQDDLLLKWNRGEAQGEITSPFDLMVIEMEQAPRGSVTLQGARGAEKRSWTLGPRDWGIKTRPQLPANILSIYLEAEKLAEAGKLDQADERWRMAAVEAQKSPSSPLPGAWLAFHEAEQLAGDQRWKEADDAYRQAIQRTSGIGSAIVAISRAWGETLILRSEWENAVKCYQRALEESKKSTEQDLLTAFILNKLGIVYWNRGDLASAEPYFHQALAIREKLVPGSLPVAGTLNNLGLVTAWRGDLQKSEEYYRQALAIRQKLASGSGDVSATLMNLCSSQRGLGNLAAAEDYCRQAVAIDFALDPQGLDYAADLTNLGVVAWTHGDLVSAEDDYHRSIAIEEKLIPGSLGIAGNLLDIGLIMDERGDLVKAEQYDLQALEIQEKLAPGSVELSSNLSNLGNIAADRGDLARAEEYYRKAIELMKKQAPQSAALSLFLSNLGEMMRIKGDLAQAGRYEHEALAMQEKLSPENPETAVNFDNLGNLAVDEGDLDKAQQYYLRTLGLRTRQAAHSRDASTTLEKLGDVALARNDLPKAEDYYRQSLAMRKKIALESADTAESLAALAGIMRRKQQPENAAQLYEEALNALESQTGRLGGSEEIRARFRAKRAGYYKEYVDLLLAQKQPEHAFQVLERLRARILLETLAAARVDIHKGVDPALAERERSLQELLSAKSNRRMQLPDDTQSEKQSAELDAEIKELLAQYKDVEEQIRASSPAYAALTQPQPLSASQVQQQVLDADTLLLEYSLGKERSYIFALTPDSLHVYELPAGDKIESKARRVYELLAAQNTISKSGTGQQTKTRASGKEVRYSQAVAGLSQMVLGPVATLLAGKRLLIVSDGALQYVPFAVLSAPSASGSQPAVPLVEEHVIANLPSASVLAELRREVAERKPAGKAVAVLADPVFVTKDDRVRDAQAANRPDQKRLPEPEGTSQAALSDISAESEVDRSAQELGILGEGIFPRLPFTRREADAIDSIAGKDDALEALDFDASKATALSRQLKDYRIVHFATHGLLNNEHPELSGLVFSLVDRQGNQQDGFLGLLDIYNLQLNADLVVLSACQTALGKEIGEEGLLGLTRGFMYAGAPRVVASLWKVDDEATAELMKKFYEGMLRDHQPPAQSLRAAQQWMRAQKQWHSPYYWAGFELQGEWR